MADILQLDSSIFNRIAAGEVVENPRSVVKELVENSIDAGAKNIIIELCRGGLDFLRVTDDGKGMQEEDLNAAFLPHATSKIKTLMDLDKIATLGFRGEALPSIASVAKVTMTSRQNGNELGHTVVYENGINTFQSEIGAPLGTSITVENLFQNVPARAKFLRKPSMEEADVTDLLSKIILSNPLLSFKYIVDGKTMYHSNGGGLNAAIYTIYGNILDNLTPISGVMPDITLGGFISKPSFTRHNRTYQTLIVNGRYVINSDISYCIQQCYQEFLMRRQFPMYILNIDIPLDLVDVNVHPNKMDVKFVNMKHIKGIIYNIMRKVVLAEAEKPKNIVWQTEELITNSQAPANQDMNFLSDASMNTDDASETEQCKSTVLKKNLDITYTDVAINNEAKEESLFNKQDFREILSSELFSGSYKLKEPRVPRMNNNASLENDPIYYQPLDENKTKTQELAATKTFANEIIDPYMQTANQSFFVESEKAPLSKSEQSESFLKKSELQIIGKLFNTYLLLQEDANVYFIDQHAAHEKLLYDKLTKALDSAENCVQDLLLPYIFDVSHTEKVLIDECLTQINDLGFLMRPLSGLSYALSGVPVCCSAMNMQSFTSLFLRNLSVKAFKKSDFLKETLMQAACKAAVKGEMPLSEGEMRTLLNEMKEAESTLFCPHGRPTVLRLTREEIEKWFKRIVS